jgi:hypothetical protein
MKKIFALLIGCGTVISVFAQTPSTQATQSYAVVTPMSNEQFTTLLRKVRNHVRNSSRYEAALTAVNDTSNRFNTSQLKMLLESFDGDEQRLALATTAYDRVSDKINYATLANTLSLQANKDALASFIMSQDKTTTVYSYSESFRAPMADASFSSAINDIERQWQEGARLSTIIDVLDKQGSYFTSAQAKQLISLVYDESSRLHLAKAAYSKVVDPENYAQVYELIKPEEMLNNLKTYIGANAHSIAMVHNSGKIAMTDAAFSSRYDEARNHFRNKSIIKDVNNFFADNNSFYTSFQARQMILLINGEKNRLAAAKAAYRGITDPSNFAAQMRDLFNSQRSRDDLQSYVDNYRG